jgi:hypothetical protein
MSNEQKEHVNQRHCFVCDKWLPVRLEDEPIVCSNPKCPFREPINLDA